jgi:hypothetical protein
VDRGGEPHAGLEVIGSRHSDGPRDSAPARLRTVPAFLPIGSGAVIEK